MRRVILESPFAGEIEENLRYARLCLRDSLERGEAPIASHLLYTQPGVLDDSDPAERDWGIRAGLAWREFAEAAVFYLNRGMSPGMIYAKDKHLEHGLIVETRWLNGYVAPVPASERNWIDVTTLGGAFEVQMDASKSRLVCRHREHGASDWLDGLPPHA